MTPSRTYLLAALLIFLGVVIVIAVIVTRHHTPAHVRRRLVAAQQPGRNAVLLALVVPCGYVLLTLSFVSFAGGSTFIRALSSLPMAFMFAAMQTLRFSRRPTGDRLRCSICKYDLHGLEPGTPSAEPGTHDARCPECGNQWGWPGGSIKAEHRWVRKWVIITALLLLPLLTQFGSVPIRGILWWNRTLLRVVPTPSLVQEVLTSKSFTMDAWAELATRTESPHHTARIANQLLSRPTGAYFNPDENAWLTRKLLTRSIDDALIRPRLQKLFTLTADAASTSDLAILRINPNATEFAPFQALEACITIRSDADPDGSRQTSRIIATQGSAIFAKYSMVPLPLDNGGKDQRFRGTMTVLLQKPGSIAPSPGGPPRIAGVDGCLYSAEVRLDLPTGPEK